MVYFDTNQQKSFIKRVGDKIVFRLNLSREGGTGTGNINRKIYGSMPFGFRAKQTCANYAVFTNDLNRADQFAGGDVDIYGNYEVRWNGASTSYNYTVLQGEYQPNLD